jgi:DNA-binding transcriptional LysR family regulator
LESEIGGQLFRRGRNGTRLTDVGGLLLDQAGELVRRADQLLDDMRRAARGEIGKLSIGFGFHTFDLVPRVVAQLRRRAPEVQVKLRDMSTREQLVGLSSGTIDIGFVRLPVADDFEQLGFFCPTPENVKSVERGFAQVLERFTPVYGISVSSNQGINVYF